MTRDEIISMAREAGFRTGSIELHSGAPLPFVAPVSATDCLPEVERLVSIAAAAERTAMARHFDVSLHNALRAERDALRTELDALLAWKEEAERQEPVAEVVEQDTSTHGHARGIRHLQAELLPAKTRLYTRPIPAQSAQEGWQLMPKEVADLYGFMCSAFVPMTGQQEEIAKQLDLAKQAMKAEPKPEVK